MASGKVSAALVVWMAVAAASECVAANVGALSFAAIP